jgi:tetratricopeptide (TPR) repeat protein
VLVVRWLAGFSLGSLLASGVAAEVESDSAAALDLAIATAESSLQRGDLPAAESQYRRALFEGWFLMGTLERLERRLPEARAALRNASNFAGEDRQPLRFLATAQLELGESGPAVEILTGLAGKDPKDVETRCLLAKALAAGGHLEQAVKELDGASATAPDDPELVFLLGTEYLWLKRPDNAERLFAQIAQARPIPQTHVLIGRAYRDSGEYERARGELRAALSQDPSVRRAHYYLGMVILADATTGPDRLDRAMAEFLEELKRAPNDPLTNDQLGMALLQAGREAEALPALETAVRGEARSRFVYHLGRCQLALGRPAEAVTSSRRALDLALEQGAPESELGQIHYQLGLALRKLGALDEAAAELAEARRLAQGTDSSHEGMAMPGRAVEPPREASPLSEVPRSKRLELEARVKAGLARAYFNLGVLQVQRQGSARAAERFTQAAEFFERAAEVEPNFPQLQSSLGVAYFNARQFEKATGPLTRAVSANPEDAGLKRMLAMSWLNIEAWEKASALLQDDPERTTNPSLQFAYGLALLRSRHATEAESVLAGLLTQQGDSAELSLLLGQAQAEQSKYGDAIEALRRALQLKADLAGANATLGAIYLRQKRLAEAEEALRAELKGNPNDLQSQHNLAVVLDSEHRSEEAIPMLRLALQLKPDFGDARYLLGKILLAQGSLPEAVEQLEAAARLVPGDATVHDQLGRAYKMLGRKEQARQEFEASRKLRIKP